VRSRDQNRQLGVGPSDRFVIRPAKADVVHMDGSWEVTCKKLDEEGGTGQVFHQGIFIRRRET
jgi:hypothetical protein